MKGTGQHTVLVVDDEGMMRAYLRTMLRAAGFRAVAEAGDVTRARKALARRPASMVLLDVNLSGENGLTALKTLRDEHPDTALIMLSADATAANVQAAIADGACGLMAKPFAAENVYRSAGHCSCRPATEQPGVAGGRCSAADGRSAAAAGAERVAGYNSPVPTLPGGTLAAGGENRRCAPSC